jgi:hypothetical protein
MLLKRAWLTRQTEYQCLYRPVDNRRPQRRLSGGGQLDTTTASVIIGLGAAVVAGGSTLTGVVLTLKASGEQQARTLLAQERRDKATQDEIRQYRNHERRIDEAAKYIAALDAFRRAVNGLNRDNDESRDRATTAARASADAGALVDLYFSESVQERSAAASGIVVDMHLRRLADRELGDRDKDAKAARHELINAMKRQLGESEDHQEDSNAAVQTPHHHP